MYEYVTNYHGAYIQTIDGGPEICRMDEVAFMFDCRQGCLLSHGTPESVLVDLETKKRKRCLWGFREYADDLIYFQGKFDLAEINRMANSDDYVVEFYHKTYPQARRYPPTSKFEL